jgi:Tfp pilus assembly protein PilN
VAQINYEIDLRSPECRNHYKFFKPKTCRILLYLLVPALLIVFCFMLDSYQQKLQAETELLKNELATKVEAAAPLLAMSAELETSKQRSAIAENLLSGYLIKTAYLKEIRAAAPPGVNLSYLAIDAEGKVELRGNCLSLQSAALYAKELRELTFNKQAELTTADLNEEKGCFFSISANLTGVAGGGGYEQ